MSMLIIIAVICAFFVKGLCGFANTLVFSTIMSYQSNNVNITPVELIVGYPSNFYIAWKERKSISKNVCLPLSVLVILGIIPGALFLKVGNVVLLKTLFGFAVVLIGFEMMLREKQRIVKQSSKGVLALIGIISGVLCGLFGIGAFLVAYINRTTKNHNEFRGNLSIVFLIENTFRLVLYSLTGIINVTIIKEAINLMPFMLIGLLLGIASSKSLSEKMVKKVVIILLIISGVSLILNNIFLI